MKYLSLGVVLLASAAAVSAQTPADKSDQKIAKEPITLTGCVEAGKAAGTFVLTHVVKTDSPTASMSPMPQPSISNPTVTPPIVTPPATPPAEQPTAAPPATQPSPTATSGTDAAAAIYWLDPPEKLKGHVGHKVSVSGTLESDVDKAEIKDKGDKVKIEAERGSRSVEARPGTAGAAAAKDAATGDKQPSYKVKVNTVTMISGTCSQ